MKIFPMKTISTIYYYTLLKNYNVLEKLGFYHQIIEFIVQLQLTSSISFSLNL